MESEILCFFISFLGAGAAGLWTILSKVVEVVSSANGVNLRSLPGTRRIWLASVFQEGRMWLGEKEGLKGQSNQPV